MRPQFVDFNADGHVDIVAGTFRGSPFAAYGSPEGFRQPVDIRDRDGKDIVINDFWNHDEKKWDVTTRCNPKGGEELPKGQLTSAFAFDYDNDGDFDLILGDYDGGIVYRRMNHGTNAEPKFDTVNYPLMSGGKAIKVPGKCATPMMVDWNGDGLMDLVAGSMGDSYGEGDGGGVYWWKNTGYVGSPEFAAYEALVAPSTGGATTAATRPDAGMYMDVVDADGDGDLDILVGGYSKWSPAKRELTEEEQARVGEIRAQIAELNKVTMEYSKELTEAVKGLDKEAAAEKRKEIAEKWRPKLTELNAKRAPLQKELDALVPRQQRVSYTWLYENTSAKPAAASAEAGEKTDTASK